MASAARAGREYALGLGLGAVGAGLLLLSVRQGWARVIIPGTPPIPGTDLTVRGQDLVPLAGALGLVSLFMDSSSELIHALLPLYLVGVLGASTLDVGIIEGIAEATAAVTKVFSGVISDWLAEHPRWRFVFTPKHASWLNQVEIFFSILARRLLKRGAFTSEHDLAQQMLAFVETHNQTTRPFN